MSRDVDPFFQPIPAMELARFAGVLTFMRLPHMTPDHPRFDDINIGLLGVPWDGGTTNRPGARHGPRQMRDLSTIIRAMNPVINISPFASVNCAGLGDVPPNPVDIQDSLTGVTDFISVMKKKILCQ
jgi:guanidinopropionase